MIEDLHCATAAIHEAAALVAEATAFARRSLAELEHLDADAGFAAHDLEWRREQAVWDVAAVTRGASGSVRAEEALVSIAERLASTVQAMEEAETAAFRTMSFGTHLKEAGADWLGLVMYPARAAMWAAWQVSLPGNLTSNEDSAVVRDFLSPGVPSTTGLINRDTIEAVGTVVPEDATRALAATFALNLGILEQAFGEARLIGIRVRSEQPPALPAPHSSADVVRGLASIAALGDGSVGVQRVNGPDGEAYIVSIPGTQDWSLWDDNHVDLQGNTEIRAGLVSDQMKSVISAMEAAGIPRDAPVMLAGHSQGGITAMALAASPTLLAGFNVTHVMTLGACGAGYPVPKNVQVLHLEHPEDIVPGLDLRPSAAGPNETTFTHAISQSPDPELAKRAQVINTAHTFQGYIATAELAESGVSKSVDAFTASATPFIGPDTVATSTTVYSPVMDKRN